MSTQAPTRRLPGATRLGKANRSRVSPRARRASQPRFSDDQLARLRDCWCVALDAAETALHGAKVVLSAEELRGRTEQLRDERAGANRALESLARAYRLAG